MIILGIDPGYDRLGIAVLEHNDSKNNLIFSDCFVSNRDDALSDRIAWIGKKVSFVIDEFKPECLAIEKTFFSKNKKIQLFGNDNGS